MILGNRKVRINKFVAYKILMIIKPFIEKDLFPFVATLIPSLFWSLEYGILCGMAANISYILYSSAKPQIRLYNEKVSDLNEKESGYN